MGERWFGHRNESVDTFVVAVTDACVLASDASVVGSLYPSSAKKVVAEERADCLVLVAVLIVAIFVSHDDYPKDDVVVV